MSSVHGPDVGGKRIRSRPPKSIALPGQRLNLLQPGLISPSGRFIPARLTRARPTDALGANRQRAESDTTKLSELLVRSDLEARAVAHDRRERTPDADQRATFSPGLDIRSGRFLARDLDSIAGRSPPAYCIRPLRGRSARRRCGRWPDKPISTVG